MKKCKITGLFNNEIIECYVYSQQQGVTQIDRWALEGVKEIGFSFDCFDSLPKGIN